MNIRHRVESTFTELQIDVEFFPANRDQAARLLMAEARRVAVQIDPDYEEDQ